MPFIQTNISDLLVFEPKVFEDNRGFFFESFNQQTYLAAGIEIDFVQDNQSWSKYGVIRGLHYQLNPHAQTKLIRVLAGKILDVACGTGMNFPMFPRKSEITAIDLSPRITKFQRHSFPAKDATVALRLGWLRRGVDRARCRARRC